MSRKHLILMNQLILIREMTPVEKILEATIRVKKVAVPEVMILAAMKKRIPEMRLRRKEAANVDQFRRSIHLSGY